MFPSKRKFERKYTCEEAAQMIMESDEDEAGVENWSTGGEILGKIALQ